MPERYVGLMSGTSLDGVDAVVAEFDGGCRLVHACYQPFQPQLRQDLLALQDPGRDELHRAAVAAQHLAHVYAEATRTLLAQAGLAAQDIRAAGCHGQTVRHRPDAGYTLQVLNGALLAELSGIAVVCDFRSRDIAAGGQGAPLVPAFHQARFHDSGMHRAVVNVGGIANITDIPACGAVTGFDCGPGNLLMDAWIMEQQGKAFDDKGAWALEGRVLPGLLRHLLSHPFFAAAPPKSTGRETFNLAWVKRSLDGKESPADVQATLLELTAGSIAGAIATNSADAKAVYVCGGGAHNAALMARLRALMTERSIAATDTLGVPADWVEAMAFAWLAHQTLHGEPGNLPAVTGASGPRILGAIYPA